MIEAMKQALEALDISVALNGKSNHHGKFVEAYESLRQAIAELESQEPVAWTLLLVGEHHGMIGKAGEKFLGHPEHYDRVDVYTHPQQRTEQNFCPRCGKRTNDIHTCTPPQEKNT